MDKKQKVLIVHNYYLIPGGEDTVVANEKKLLEDNGHEVICYTRHNSELNTLSKLKKLLLPFSTIFNLRTYKEVRQIIKKEKIEIVHVHNTLNLVSPSVYYAAFSCHVPVVQTVHNFRLLCPGATFYREGHICEDCVSKGLICAVKHKCYRGSRIQTLACVISTWLHRVIGTYRKLNYICLTEFNKEKLLQLKQIRDKQVFVKPNFVENTGKSVPYEKREKQIVYVGRLDKLKGVDLLLEAWNSLKEEQVKLIICGIGPLEKWCKDYISAHQMKNVEMKGFLPNAEVREIIENSLAMVMPTQWYEGFPMTILEAYSAGTPVIGADIGNVGNIIENGKSGWKFRYDSKELFIKAILKVVKDTIVFEKGFIDKYLPEYNYKELKAIYDEVI